VPAAGRLGAFERLSALDAAFLLVETPAQQLRLGPCRVWSTAAP